jgi:signal transduction histidine kinase
LCCFGQTGLAQTNSAKTVLALYDGGREFSSIQLTDRGIESTLNGALSNRVTIFREYMDLTRIRPANYPQILRDFYRSKYSSSRPDVIVAIRGRTLDFLLQHGDELFPGVPIVSSAMDLRQIRARKLPPNVTGKSLEVRYWPTLALALTLQPDAEQAVVILGASPNDRALEALVRDELREHGEQLKFTYLAGLPIESLLRQISHLPRRSIVLFVGFAQDGEGRSFLPNEVLTRITHAANAPTYIASDDVLDCGAVGGALLSFEALGRDAAAVTLRILNGESPASIPFSESSARIRMLDAGQLERWGIPLSRVPVDSVILNRVPTLWEARRWQIVGAATLVIFQSVLIGLLLVHRRRRRTAEQGLRLSEAYRRAAVLEERNRMARDIHDTLAQGFTGVIVQLEAAEHAFTHGSSPDTDAHIRRARDLARYSLDEARRSIKALRPQALESGDLRAALEGAMRQMTEGTKLHAEFATRGEPRALRASDEENLLRINQEILTNALKHSQASELKTTLWFEVSSVGLEVRDNGVGFDPAKQHDGFGLLGISERVKQMNGDLTVDSRPGSGTRVRVVLPCSGSRE